MRSILSNSFSNDPSDAAARAQLKVAFGKFSDAATKATSICRTSGTPAQGWSALAEDVQQALALLNEEPSVPADATATQYIGSTIRYAKVLKGALSQLPAAIKALKGKNELDITGLSAAHSVEHALTRLSISAASIAKKTGSNDAIEKTRAVGKIVQEIFISASSAQTVGKVDSLTAAAVEAINQFVSTLESGGASNNLVADAINIINQAVSLAQTHRGALPNCPARGVRDVAQVVKSLGDSIGQTIAASSSAEKDKTGAYAKQVAGLAHNLLELSTIFNQFFNYFTGQHKLIQQNLTLLRNPNPSDPQVVEAIKVIVRVCAETADASTLAAEVEDNPLMKKRLIDAAQGVRTVRVTLISAAKEATQSTTCIPKLVEAGNTLLMQFSYMISLCPLASTSCPQILDEALFVADNLKKLLNALKNAVAAKDAAATNNSVNIAKSYINTVSESVKSMLSIIKQLGPSQRQCEEAKNILQRVAEELTAAALSATIGDIPPANRNYTEVKVELTNQLKELAAAMQKFNVQQDTNSAQFSPTVEALGNLGPRFANTTKQLASTHPSPVLQVDYILSAKELIDALHNFISILKNVAVDLDQASSITTAAQRVQAKVVELVNGLKKGELGLTECDAAMNAIGALLPSLDAPQPNPQLNLAKCQEVISAATKQVVGALSGLSKAQKASPDAAIGEFSKTLGDSLSALIKATTASVHFIFGFNPQLCQSLLFNTKEVAISIGNYLQFSKNAALSPKDPSHAGILDNQVKVATTCISKLVVAQKELAAIKA
eukprot:TRINITY_DN8912_c0_g1_i1.p1 TRINITY_DN8912_c0_g1~~TRINITY_DN8912_c0_g1_i1.p1  ORF type:complete len:780 (-),score=246.23 TRINITY_DN8912_c0_g1_i1:295-2634(-)